MVPRVKLVVKLHLHSHILTTNSALRTLFHRNDVKVSFSLEEEKIDAKLNKIKTTLKYCLSFHSVIRYVEIKHSWSKVCFADCVSPE